jgi:hypothetical protein
MKSAMRTYRRLAGAHQDTRFIEQDIAFYTGWTGHSDADNCDGWKRANPKGYTTDGSIHGRFKTHGLDRNRQASARRHRQPQ